MSGLVRGAFRVLIAPPSARHPDKLSDILDENFDPVGPWMDLGAVKTGMAHNGLAGLVGPEEREDAPRQHFVMGQFGYEGLAVLAKAMGRQVRIVWLRQLDNKDIEGNYFPLATVQPFGVVKGMGERSSSPVRFDVGPHGFRKLTHEQEGSE